MSPTARTSGCPRSVRSGSTSSRPASSRSAFACSASAAASGDGVTPAAHTTVCASIRSRTPAAPAIVTLERMPEAHPSRLDPEQSGVLGRLQIGEAHARAAEGRHGERAPRPLVERVEPVGDERGRALTGLERLLGRDVAAQLRSRQRGGHLEQRERVAGADREDPGHDARFDLRRGRAADHASGSVVVEREQLERGKRPQVHGRIAVAAGAQQQDDTFVPEAARREPQHGDGRVDAPLHVVDGAENRRRLGGRGQQRHNAGTDREAIGRTVVAHRQGALERAPLRGRNGLSEVQDRRQQLRHAGVGQVALDLDAGRAQHPQAAGPGDRRLQQRRLARPGRPLDHEGGRFARPHSREQLPNPRELPLAPDRLHRHRARYCLC
jgi:hypothetical protein